MLLRLKMILVVSAIVIAIIGSLVFTVHLKNNEIQRKAVEIAQVQDRLAASNQHVKSMQDDAIRTKLNQDWLNAKLSDIRTDSQVEQNKVVIPPRYLHKSSELELFINHQTSEMLKSFEAQTRNGKK